MKEKIVGIGQIELSQKAGDILVSYSLGSCVAVTIYDKTTKTAVMAHIALNNSNTNLKRAKKTPGYFADTAIDEMLKKIKKKGVEVNKKNLQIKIAGGAQVLEKIDFFKIGEKNIETIRSIFKDKKLVIQNEDVGGKISRTVRVEVSTGKVTVKNVNKGTWEL